MAGEINMFNNQVQQPKPPQTFGNIQNTYVFRLSQFINGDQITIVEDLHKNKPIREAKKHSLKGNDYTVYLIRINSNGFEADLELFVFELSALAMACPKGTENLKGMVLIHNGRSFTYLMGNMPIPEISVIPDRRQPDLNPPSQPVDQVKADIDKMCADMKSMYAVNSSEYKIDIKVLTNVANSILPGKALDLIQAAKTQGAIYEQPIGVYKAS